MQKIKILYIIDKLDTGGAQHHLLQLLRQIDRNKFKPYLCCLLYEGELIDKVKDLGVSVLTLDIKRIYTASGISGLIKLKGFIKKEAIDIIHTYLFSANILGNLAAKLAKAPLIISGRRDTGLHREGKWQHRQAYKVAHSLADKVFAVSNAVKDIIHTHEGVNLKKIITIYNGIDANTDDADIDTTKKKAELGINSDDKVIGMIANLSWVKGHDYFFNAAQLISQEMPDTKFLIIGDGLLKNKLKEKVKSLNLEKKVLFLGRRTDIGELLKIMDVSVNASYSEGMSNTILESMAAGIPTVATDVDGNKDRKSTRLNSSHIPLSRMPSSA